MVCPLERDKWTRWRFRIQSLKRGTERSEERRHEDREKKCEVMGRQRKTCMIGWTLRRER